MKTLIFILCLFASPLFAADKHPLTGLSDNDMIHATLEAHLKGPIETRPDFQNVNVEVILIFKTEHNGTLATHDYIASKLKPKLIEKTQEGTFVYHQLEFSGARLNEGADFVVNLAKEYGYTGEEKPRIMLVNGIFGAAPHLLEITENGFAEREFKDSKGSSHFRTQSFFTYIPEKQLP